MPSRRKRTKASRSRMRPIKPRDGRGPCRDATSTRPGRRACSSERGSRACGCDDGCWVEMCASRRCLRSSSRSEEDGPGPLLSGCLDCTMPRLNKQRTKGYVLARTSPNHPPHDTCRGLLPHTSSRAGTVSVAHGYKSFDLGVNVPFVTVPNDHQPVDKLHVCNLWRSSVVT